MANNYQGEADGIVTQEEFVSQVWASGVMKFFERGSVLRGLCDDYSSLAKKGAGTVNIPDIAMIDAAGKTTDDGVTYNATHSTDTNLVLNKHEYVGKIFEDILSIQAQPDMVIKYVQMFGESLARQVDLDIFAEIEGMTTTLALGSADTITEANLESILGTLGSNDIPYQSGDVAFVCNPLLIADMLNPTSGLTKYFLRNDASGSDGMLTGQLGTFYGMPLIMSNSFDSGVGSSKTAGAIFHKSAIAFASVQDIRVQHEYSIDALGTKVVADIIYGVERTDKTGNLRGITLDNPAS